MRTYCMLCKARCRWRWRATWYDVYSRYRNPPSSTCAYPCLLEGIHHDHARPPLACAKEAVGGGVSPITKKKSRAGSVPIPVRCFVCLTSEVGFHSQTGCQTLSGVCLVSGEPRRFHNAWFDDRGAGREERKQSKRHGWREATYTSSPSSQPSCQPWFLQESRDAEKLEAGLVGGRGKEPKSLSAEHIVTRQPHWV
ncbi:hypothetical protein LY76DRAFT_12889 [Colletotrichum caudatum]|nr:hypothetical protein LY76DRAFT_12889 [Colletotrichum caudatum]